MAERGSKKQRSVEHEEFIAGVYEGKRSPSSGAAAHDQGDVRTNRELFDCKMQGSSEQDAAREPGEEPIRPTLLRSFEKLADEAWSEGKEPVIAWRIWAPEMVVADDDGWVNLTIRLTEDDAWRSDRLRARDECSEDGKRWR